jgi:hypothetical protein
MGSEVYCDLALARRLERTEASANARFVEARARVSPELGAEWIEVARAYAMFDGAQSPCTQTFGLGLFQMPTSAEMERIESFFRIRKAPVLHEVSPLADVGLVEMLSDRGYRPVELSNVLFLRLSERIPMPGGAEGRHANENCRRGGTRLVGEDQRGWVAGIH